MNQKIIDLIDSNVKVVSFDVFDTLLFRIVKEPADVFSYMYDKKTSYFPADYNRDSWRKIRGFAERKANGTAFGQNKINKEIKLKDIYSCMPPDFSDLERLHKLELECERDVCYINQEIYSTIIEIKETLDCKVILISDMYMSKEEIVNLLNSCGVSDKYIDDIYVSSECGVSKKNGLLFEKVMKELGISESEILHIGDNMKNDYASPNSLGIKSFLYDVIPNGKFDACFAAEKFIFSDETASELYSIRLAALSSSAYSGDDEICFKIGAGIVGPFFADGIEWVLDYAQEHNISTIRCMMREGETLVPLLRKAAEFRNADFDIEPLYISRNAMFKAGLDKVSEKDISYIVNTQGIVIREVFEFFELNNVDAMFSEYLDVAVAASGNIMIGENSLYKHLINYLQSEEVLDIIRSNGLKYKEDTLKYLRKMKLDEECITLDLGWRGFTQNQLDKILPVNGKRHHLLLVSREGVVANSCDDGIFRGYIGTAGRDTEEINRNFDRLLELMIMGESGTTLGYSSDCKGEVQPILKKVDYLATQRRLAKRIVEGIFKYQSTYLSSGKKDIAQKFSNHKINTFRFIERLFSFPNKEEAEVLSRFEYDQNFGVRKLTPIVCDEVFDYLQEVGTEEFYAGFRTSNVVWYSGLNVLYDPFFHLKTNFLAERKYRGLSFVSMIEKAIKLSNGNGVVIVGAGNNGKQLLAMFAALGMLDYVKGFVDNNEALHGINLVGKEIKSVGSDWGNVTYLSSILSVAESNQLKVQIQTERNRTISYVDYGRNM